MSAVWESNIESGRRLLALAIADSCNDQGIGWPSVGELARKCDIDPRSVQRQLLDLEPFVKREFRPGRSTIYHVDIEAIRTYQPPTPESPLTPDASVTPDSTVTPDASVTTPPTPASPTPDASVTQNHLEPFRNRKKESPKRKKNSVPDFDHESLQYVCSATFFERLVGLGKIAESTVTEKKLQAGADAFDRVTRIKPGFSWEDVQETMHWLLQRDNWWMVKRAILSPTKLMEKHDKNDCTYFETIRSQFLADSEARYESLNGSRGSGSVEDEIAKTVAGYSGVD